MYVRIGPCATGPQINLGATFINSGRQKDDISNFHTGNTHLCNYLWTSLFSDVFSSVQVNRYIFVYEEKETGIIVLNMLGATTQNSLWWVEGGEHQSKQCQYLACRGQEGATGLIHHSNFPALRWLTLLVPLFYSLLKYAKWFMYERVSPDKCLTRWPIFTRFCLMEGHTATF
jgi:hypothetical protein